MGRNEGCEEVQPDAEIRHGSEDARSNVEREFHEAMRDIYANARREADYTATRPYRWSREKWDSPPLSDCSNSKNHRSGGHTCTSVGGSI